MRRTTAVLVLLFLWLAAACAGRKEHKLGTELANDDLDRAVVHLRRAVRENPKRIEYRADLRKAEMRAGQRHMDAASDFLRKKHWDAAILELQLALAADPFIESTATGLLVKAQRSRDAEAALAEAREREKNGDASGALQSARRAIALDPRGREPRELLSRLAPASGGELEGLDVPAKPFTLKFTNTKVREAFEVFSQMSGVTFVLDEAVKDESTTLFVQEASFPRALEALLTRHRLDAKVIGARTVVVFPDTKEKRKQYRELQVETFYLANLEAAQALNLLRGVLDVKGGYVNDELNALVLRDTPEALAVARQVLAANDLERAEVLFEVEMLEIDRGKLLKLGVDLTPDQAGGAIAADPANAGAALTLDTLVHRFSARNVLITLPSVVVNLRREDTDAQILANPRIRVVDGSQAVIHIGERVPFVTVTTLNQTVSENIQFQDVGIKLTVSPDIHRDDSMTLKLALEVSSLGPSTTTASGNTVFRIGTRNASTVLRLRDGETQFLGGLVQDEERTTVARIPFLGEIPILGYLFSTHDRQRVTTDILLSITPRLIRSAPVLGPAEARVWAGREDDVRAMRADASVAPSPRTPPSPFQIRGPARAREGETVTVTLAAATSAAAEVEWIYDASSLTFQRLESGGKGVTVSASDGRVRWSAPEGAFPMTATFKAVRSGATIVRYRARNATTPGGPAAETVEGEHVVLVEP